MTLNGGPGITDKEYMKRAHPIIALLALAALSSASAQTVSEPAAFRQEGIASWYGAEFEGRPTASGERFDSRLLTAAHPTLPFGTVVKVTNAHNGKSVTVRVNDRGPFVAARIIDLSRAAGEKLDMVVTGTAPVVVEAVVASAPPSIPPSATLIPAPLPAAAEASTTVSAAATVSASAPVPTPAPAAPAVAAPAAPAAPAAATAAVVAAAAEVPTPIPAPIPEAAESVRIAARPAARLFPKAPDAKSDKKYRLQVGSYKLVRNATEAYDKLSKAGLVPSYERNGELYRVVIASVPGAEVQAAAERLGEAGFAEVLVREER